MWGRAYFFLSFIGKMAEAVSVSAISSGVSHRPVLAEIRPSFIGGSANTLI